MAKTTRTLTWLQYLVLGGAILYFGREIFIPLSFALLISFVLYPSCAWMERKGLGRMTAIGINISALVLIALALIALLTKQFVDFVKEWPTLQTRLDVAFQQLGVALVNWGVSTEQQQALLNQAGNQTASNLMNMINSTISFSIFSAVMLLLIPVYAVLILYYRHLWVEVLFRLFSEERRADIRKILALTIKTYFNFIKGMGIVYLAVGILNSVGLLLLGVPHAILFGFIASILTFIPYVGILVGALLPMTVAWATYDSAWYPLGVMGIFMFVQYLEANVIFPFAVSSRLNVNTLVMLIAIFVGGVLWGVAGMILFVPFVGILKLVADHDPKLKTLSLALGTSPKSSTETA
jgi:predicted PurR-regulated permease PerM